MASDFLGYERGRLLLDALGSFWSRIFKDDEVLQGHMEGLGSLYGQRYFDLLEIVLGKSVFDIPVFHREKWTLILLKESELNKNSGAFLKYDRSVIYGPQEEGEFAAGTEFAYGGTLPGVFSWRLPEGLVDIESYVMNRIHNPSVVLVKGKDYLVRNGVIFFAGNPLENPLLAVRDIRDSTGAVIDRELSLWALNSDFDFQYVWLNYGSVINFYMESSKNYKNFLAAVWSLFFAGPRVEKFISAVNGLLGLPVILEEQETVIQIYLNSGDFHRIVTDKHEYLLRATAELSLSVIPGATLSGFTPLTEAVNIVDSVLVPKWWNTRDFVPIPMEILNEEFTGSMIIRRTTVDVPAIWGQKWDTGIVGRMSALQQTLFQNFPLQWGTPGLKFGNESVVIEPLSLFMDNYYSAHVILLEIDTSQVVTELISRQLLEILNDALPAYVHFIGILEVPLEDTYDLGEQVIDVLDNPSRGKASPENSGDLVDPSDPNSVIADLMVLGGLYDPKDSVSFATATVPVTGDRINITGGSLTGLTVGTLLRLDSSEEVTIYGIIPGIPGTSFTLLTSPAATPASLVSVDKLLLGLEDVYTFTIDLGGVPGVATFGFTSQSGRESDSGISIPAFGSYVSIGDSGLTAMFQDAPSGTAADGELVLGDSWVVNVRREYLGGTQPGLIDPASIPAVNLVPDEYETPDDFQDGYWGIPRWGDPLTWGMTDPQTGSILKWGTAFFVPGMRIFLRSGPCVPISASPLPGP